MNESFSEKIKIYDEVDFYLIDLKSRFDKIRPNEYYLSYSGGVDSHFLYWFIKEYLKRDDIKIVGINTFMEHQEILQRINKNSDIVLFPKMKPMDIKDKYGSPCFSKFQDEYIRRYQSGSKAKSTLDYIFGKNDSTMFKLSNKARNYILSESSHKISPKCCDILKKEPSSRFQKETNLKPILGVRGEESKGRKSKYKSCFTKNGKFTPIYDLPDELLYKIMSKYDIEKPKIYEKISRTGCIGCPYGSYKGNTEKELQLTTDNQFEFVCKYFKESYEVLGIDVDKIREQRKDEEK